MMTEKEIAKICKKYNIKYYQINSDMSIDVDGNVDLSNKNLEKLPLKFGEVTGYFKCSRNKLTSLEGCPNYVGSLFSCYGNNLITFYGGPKKVKRDVNCFDNKLTSFKYSPKYIGGDFMCSKNKFTSFEHVPEYIGGRLYMYNASTYTFNIDRIIRCPTTHLFDTRIRISSGAILWKF